MVKRTEVPRAPYVRLFFGEVLARNAGFRPAGERKIPEETTWRYFSAVLLFKMFSLWAISMSADSI